MGEWFTFLILAKGIDPATQVDEASAKMAAEGWGNDGYKIYYHPSSEETVLLLIHTWESELDVEEYVSAFERYATARFGDPHATATDSFTWQGAGFASHFYVNQLRTTWVLGPDLPVVNAVLDVLEQR